MGVCAVCGKITEKRYYSINPKTNKGEWVCPGCEGQWSRLPTAKR